MTKLDFKTTILKNFENAPNSNTNKYVYLLCKKEEDTISQIKDATLLFAKCLF